MVKTENKKINKIEKLAEIIATNVLKLTEDMGEVKKDVGELKKDMMEVKGNVKNIRKDVLNLGDRFPSQFAFDQLSNRVYSLEKKSMSKK
jgi:archaellum component FlaC